MTLFSPNRRKIAILGGGAAGVAVAARLSRLMKNPDITLVESSTKIDYPALWPLVGAGLAKPEEAVRELGDFLPPNVRWVRAEVKKFDPLERVIETEDKQKIHFEFLVMAPNPTVDHSEVKGLQEALGSAGVASVFGLESAIKARAQFEEFAGGTAIFTHQGLSAYGDQAHRALFLFDALLRKKGLREKTKLIFCTTEANVFALPALQSTVGALLKEKGIEVLHLHSLKKLDPAGKKATFEILDEEGKKKETAELSYDLLHVMPLMGPDKVVSKGKTAAKKPLKGWVEVDAKSLQHPKYKHVFGVGDLVSEPVAKAGLSLRYQVASACHNLVKTMSGAGSALFHEYEGHTYCPLETAPKRALLAEFKGEKPARSFGVDLSKEGYLPWLVERYLLPQLYWRFLLRGLV